MRRIRVVGLALVLVDAVLGTFVLLALGLVLLAAGRTRTRGPADRVDAAVGVTALLYLLVSVTQPMYFLIPSLELLAGCILAWLSRLWRGVDLLLCLLVVPCVLVVGTAVASLLWAGPLPGPHGPAVLVFTVAALYGPVAAVALAGAWLLRRRAVTGPGEQAELAAR